MKKSNVFGIIMKSMLLCVAVLLIFASDKAYAATDFTKAVSIELNQDVYGMVSTGSNGESNIYRIELPSDGRIVTKLKYPRQSGTGSYWKITLYNSEYKYIDATTAKGNYDETAMTAMGLAAGEYYVSVSSANAYSAASKDMYTLFVDYEENSNWEKELNNSFDTANLINVNQEYSGTTKGGSNGEEDYYKFIVPDDGCVDISLSYPRQKNSNSYWKVLLYDCNYEYIDAIVAKGNVERTAMPSEGLAAGEYYVRVVCAATYDLLSADTYVLLAKYTKTNTWEKERNNDFTTASNIDIKQGQYFGTLKGPLKEEADYYAFDASKNGGYCVVFRSEETSSSSVSWSIVLYNADYKELSSMSVKASAGFGVIYKSLESGRYYVRICSSDYYNNAPSDKTYSVEIIYDEESPVSLKKVTAGKSELTASWTAKKDVDGYEIQYSTKSDFSDAKTVQVLSRKAVSKKIKKLKKSKTYYVRIRALTIITNPHNKKETYVLATKWSKKLSVKIK